MVVDCPRKLCVSSQMTLPLFSLEKPYINTLFDQIDSLQCTNDRHRICEV